MARLLVCLQCIEASDNHSQTACGKRERIPPRNLNSKPTANFSSVAALPLG